MHCAFCELPEIKGRAIAQNDAAWAFPSNRAIGPCHILISPHRCVATWDEMTPEEQKDVFALRDLLKPVLQKVYGAQGFNYAWNEGEVAGQSVPHFHLHLIPRVPGDTGITGYDPRNFLYRPVEWLSLSEEQLNEVSTLLRERMSSPT